MSDQYVYLLENTWIPGIVKFGYSGRHPLARAEELSRATGVPGEWALSHYWEVADGRYVEREVFRRLDDVRLHRQEFLQLGVEEAVERIAQIVSDPGVNREAEVRESIRAFKDDLEALEAHRLHLKLQWDRTREQYAEQRVNPARDAAISEAKQSIPSMFGAVWACSMLVGAAILYATGDVSILAACLLSVVMSPILHLPIAAYVENRREERREYAAAAASSQYAHPSDNWEDEAEDLRAIGKKMSAVDHAITRLKRSARRKRR